MTSNPTYHNTPLSVAIGIDALRTWSKVLLPVVATLKLMAGTTEDEFLHIGSRMQSLYQRSTAVCGMSNQLVDVVSGMTVHSLTDRLHRMMADMQSYLSEARGRSNDSCRILEQVQQLLENLSEPMEGFQKINKSLRMLSISTKIESARLGELGSGFVNLAIDVEKLSHQVNEKSAAILAHRQRLSTLIGDNLVGVHSSEATQDATVATSLTSTASSLQELITVNERCNRFGEMVAAISSEVSNDISEMVSSMQMHDMTRQQIEHIIEALERLHGTLHVMNDEVTPDKGLAVTVECGDVCELQEAQLRFASTELCTAVTTIIGNLRDIAHKQQTMAHEVRLVAGASDSSGGSFVDVMSEGMTSITSALTSCAWADRNMSDTMGRVAGTISEIASFVTDIEMIGTEIDLIALNAQIKAAHTGTEGAALGVLAEAIKRLSDEAVRQTNSVAGTLKSIYAATEHMTCSGADEDNQLSNRVMVLQGDVAAVLRELAAMNCDISSILGGLGEHVTTLTGDVEQLIAGIDVHTRTKAMADGVLGDLARIVMEARSIVPASTEFKENLRFMEQRYTMESERHIHEAIARKRSGQSTVTVTQAAVTSGDESEFGDNVDLF